MEKILRFNKANLILCVALLLSLQISAQKAKYASLEEALSAGRNLVSGAPSNTTWIEGGTEYSYTRSEGGAQQIWVSEPSTGKEKIVFSSADVTLPGTDRPLRYREFQWTKDSRHILFQTNFRSVWRYSGNADYYHYTLADKTVSPVVEGAFTAEVSPDGSMVGYEKEGNLYMFNFSTGKHTQFTDDAEAHFYNGRFGWAYEEEFGLVQAWEWSPDSRHIAFWQSDEREVPIYQLTDFSGHHPEYMKVPYPKVGDPIPQVKIGVIDTKNAEHRWLDLDLAGGYVPRIYWTTDPDMLAVVHLNRAQNHLRLYFFNVATGDKKLVMEESSDTWIDVYDFFSASLHYFEFPDGLREFFWISDRDGWNHIYRYDYSGKLLGQVTSGNWEVVRMEAFDMKNRSILYLSAEGSSLERHLYRIGIDGRKKTRLTLVPGNHRPDVSPNGQYYFDSYSGIDQPQHVELWNTKGKMLKRFTSHMEADRFMAEHEYAPRELFQFTTTDGQVLDGYLVKPPDFDPSRAYPLLLDIYGGPGSQSVYNSFSFNGWHQYLAQEGFVIAGVNNRGNGNYGRDFEKRVYRKLGEWESHDFVETARYLATFPWIDGNRMAIRGHSYGGFMSAYTMLRHPGVFRVSLVAAPVTDQRLYDCIYTERYMGLQEDNGEGYVNSAVMTYAGNLEGKMLLVHSLMDENVHPQNTFQLVKALIDNGKDIDLRIYPPGAHGVAYDHTSSILLMKTYTDYLVRYLKESNE